jgi:hypothetical protein
VPGFVGVALRAPICAFLRACSVRSSIAASATRLRSFALDAAWGNGEALQHRRRGELDVFGELHPGEDLDRPPVASISNQRRPWRAVNGNAWWLLCQPSRLAL